MRRSLPSLTTILASLSLVKAQDVTPSPSSTWYEELPKLKASEILRENILNGPLYNNFAQQLTQRYCTNLST